MMKHGMRVAILAATLALAGCLHAGTPEEQLKSIEALQAKNFPLTDKQKTGIGEHIAKGREALAAGNKEQAGEAFAAALAILKIAEDTDLFNKAD